MDHNSRHWKKDTGFGDETVPQTPRYLIQRSQNQWGSESQNWKHHRAVWKPPDFSEKTQTEVARARHTIIWTILQGTVQGGRQRCRQRKQWEDNIKEWTGLEWNILLRKAKNREEWRKLVVKSRVVPQRSARLQDRQDTIILRLACLLLKSKLRLFSQVADH